MSKHTPGPWIYLEPHILNSDRTAIAQICSRPLREANAHLIAAAPCMYEALKNILDDHDRKVTPNWSRRISDARAALAKAEDR